MNSLENAQSLAREKIDPMKDQFLSLSERAEKIAPAGDPLLKEIETLRATGEAQVHQALLMLDIGNPDRAKEFMSHAIETYNEGVGILVDLMQTSLRQKTGPSLEEEFDALFPDGVGKHGSLAQNLKHLKQLAKDLDKDWKNTFFKSYTNAQGKEEVSVVFSKVNDGRTIITAFRNTVIEQLPGMTDYLNKLEGSLSTIENMDTVGSAYNNFNTTRKEMKGNFDWKPLRILGALGATVVTSFVGIQSLVTGSMPSWVALPWVGLLALSVRPDIAFKSAQLAKMKSELPQTTEEIQTVIGLRSPEGVLAFEEVISLFKTNKLKALSGLRGLNNAQVNEIVGEGTELAKKLLGYEKESERLTALKVLMKQVYHGNEECILALLRTV